MPHLRLTNQQYVTRLRRYLRLPIRMCEYAARHIQEMDKYGDHTLSTGLRTSGNNWTAVHNNVAHLLESFAHQARISNVEYDKGADNRSN